MTSITFGRTSHVDSTSSSTKPGLLAKCATSINSFLDSTPGSHLTRLATTGLLATAYSKWDGGDKISNSIFSPLPLLSMAATAAVPAALKWGTSWLSGTDTSSAARKEVSDIMAMREMESEQRLHAVDSKRTREVSRMSLTDAAGSLKTPAEMEEQEARYEQEDAKEQMIRKQLQAQSLDRMRGYAPSCAVSIASSFAGQWLAPFAVGLAEKYTGTDLNGPMEWMATRETASLLSKGISELGQQVVKMCGYPKCGQANDEPVSSAKNEVKTGTSVEDQLYQGFLESGLAHGTSDQMRSKPRSGRHWDEKTLQELFDRLGGAYATRSLPQTQACASGSSALCQPPSLLALPQVGTAVF